MKAELILCQSSDENLENIKNIFSEISANQDNRISFTLVCKILYEEDDISENIIHIFILKHLEDNMIKGAYLSEVELIRENNDEESFKTEFTDIPVVGKGRYSISVVMNNEMKDAEVSSGSTVYDNGKLIGKTYFDVI